MEFLDFARSHGIIINDLPPFGQWVRYPTEDHPKSKNGAVKYLGDHGFVQNHATSTVVTVWKPDSDKHRASDRVQSADWARRQAKARIAATLARVRQAPGAAEGADNDSAAALGVA
jgi:putative DNA primase/helicase